MPSSRITSFPPRTAAASGARLRPSVPVIPAVVFACFFLNPPPAASAAVLPKGAPPAKLFRIAHTRLSKPELIALTSLQGILAKDGAENIYLDDGASGYQHWLEILKTARGTQVEAAASCRELLAHFAKIPAGHLLCRAADQRSLALAGTLAGPLRAVIIDESLQPLAVSLGWKQLHDTRDKDYAWLDRVLAAAATAAATAAADGAAGAADGAGTDGAGGGGGGAAEIPNPKSQIPKKFQIPKEPQISKDAVGAAGFGGSASSDGAAAFRPAIRAVGVIVSQPPGQVWQMRDYAVLANAQVVPAPAGGSGTDDESATRLAALAAAGGGTTTIITSATGAADGTATNANANAGTATTNANAAATTANAAAGASTAAAAGGAATATAGGATVAAAPPLVLGWGDGGREDEQTFVGRVSRLGLPLVPADHARNLSVLSSLPMPPGGLKQHRHPVAKQAAAEAPGSARVPRVAPGAPPDAGRRSGSGSLAPGPEGLGGTPEPARGTPALPEPSAAVAIPHSRKHTVTFVLSDGDNLGWLLFDCPVNDRWFASPARGRVPLGWGMAPVLAELAPGVVQWYYDAAAAAAATATAAAAGAAEIPNPKNQIPKKFQISKSQISNPAAAAAPAPAAAAADATAAAGAAEIPNPETQSPEKFQGPNPKSPEPDSKSQNAAPLCAGDSLGFGSSGFGICERRRAGDHFVAGPSGNGYFYPSLMPPGALAAHCAELNRLMGLADLRLVQVIDHGALARTDLWDAYLSQPNIDGLIYFDYAPYDKYRGRIVWARGKPVVSAAMQLWGPGGHASTPAKPSRNSPDAVAARLNRAPRDPYSENGYSLVVVHVWTHTVADVAALAARLDPDVEVVAPDEFFRRVQANLAPKTKTAAAAPAAAVTTATTDDDDATTTDTAAAAAAAAASAGERGGEINFAVKSGDKSPHSKKTSAAEVRYGVRRFIAAFDGGIHPAAPPPFFP